MLRGEFDEWPQNVVYVLVCATLRRDYAVKLCSADLVSQLSMVFELTFKQPRTRMCMCQKAPPLAKDIPSQNSFSVASTLEASSASVLILL
jgi:hypothetical protein